MVALAVAVGGVDYYGGCGGGCWRWGGTFHHDDQERDVEGVGRKETC